MLKKTSVIVFFLILGVALYFLYQHFRVPECVTPMSDAQENIAMISLITAVVSLLTSLVGLAIKIIDMNKKDDDD